MPSTEETLATLRREMWPLLETAMEGVLTKARGILDAAEQLRAQEIAGVAEERADGLAEVAEERAKGLAEVDARWEELHHEIAAMHKHQEAQEGRVELNVGGCRFQTSVQTLRRVLHTFFDAYFSGRHAQDVCNDGSTFVDRDGEHFGHVLEYMRDGVVSVAAPGACPSVSLLRALKREFGFYCIELYADQSRKPGQSEMAFVLGGYNTSRRTLRSMERYDASSGQWSAATSMRTAREHFGACVIAGEIYVCGGQNDEDSRLSSVEKYSPMRDTWSAVAPLPDARCGHAPVAMGSAMYVLGGTVGIASIASVLKFDNVLGTWTEVAIMPDARSGCAACAIGSDIYVIGGEIDDSEALDSVFKYDTMGNTWSTLAPMPSPACYHGASILHGLVYIVGAGDDSDETLRYDHDPASDAWSTLAPCLSGNDQGTSFVLGGSLYAAEGQRNNARVERYDVDIDIWMAVANMLEERTGSCSVTIRSTGPAEQENIFHTLIATTNSQIHP
jgi:hypothetical protein